MAREPAGPTFPVQLRNLCHSFYQVVVKRFPDEAAAALGTVLFLRFVNPTLGKDVGQEMACYDYGNASLRKISLRCSFYVQFFHLVDIASISVFLGMIRFTLWSI